MRLGVDLATEQLASAEYRETRGFFAQLLTGATRFQRGFLTSSGHQALGFRRSDATSFVRHFGRATIRLFDDLRGARMRFLDDVVRRILRFGQALLATLCGCEALGNFLLPRLDRRDDVRPAELHDQPGHREEREALDDDGYCGIHACSDSLAAALRRLTPIEIAAD